MTYLRTAVVELDYNTNRHHLGYDDVNVSTVPCEVTYYYCPEDLGTHELPYYPATVEIMLVSYLGESIMDALTGKQFDDIEDELLKINEG